ncbi:hypothetical protein P692DRAFT_20886956 [Suillus brevipes Sb2]|nr:hypothetical protein P692DRAFT_20886956 [Suillus brevipes Sb2]
MNGSGSEPPRQYTPVSNSCNSTHSLIPIILTAMSLSISAPKRQVKTGSLIVLNQLVVSAPLQIARLMPDIIPILAEVIWGIPRLT